MAMEPTVEERLERLERAVAQLQQALIAGAPAPPGSSSDTRTPPAAADLPVAPALPAAAATPTVPAVPAAAATPTVPAAPAAAAPTGPAAAPPATARDWALTSQIWIGRAGLALLVLGLAFLFRYAVMRGWLTPELRVGFGLALGAVLLGFGIRLHMAQARRRYGLLLMGGGLAVLYLSAYAAFGFYDLVRPIPALIALAVMALLAVRLAANRGEALLADLGALGAVAAPLLVQTARPSIPLLAGYILLVVVWTGWTALREGWRSLAWTVAAGAALLLLAATDARPVAGDRILLIVTSALALPGLAAALLARERLAELRPAAWRRRPAPRWRRGSDAEEIDLESAGGVTLAASLFFPLYAAELGSWPGRVLAAVALAEAALLAALAWFWHRRTERLSRAVTLAATAPLLLGTVALELPELRGLLALEALGMLALSRVLREKLLRHLGHALFLIVGIVFMVFARDNGGLAVPTPVALGDLLGIGAALAAPALLVRRFERRVYGSLGLLALLTWLYLVLAPLRGGAYWVTVSWGALGSVLLIASWLRSDGELRAGALLTLAVVALKLLLVDTAALSPGDRIVVFIGFGVLFLVLGALHRRSGLADRKPEQPG